MSGPIVRKYGFPNFEKIFGEREIKHGAEDETPAPAPEAVVPPVGPMSDAAEPNPEPPKRA